VDVTDTEDDIREFARVTPVEVAPEMARFMAAMRRLQDIVVSTNPDESLWNDTPELIEGVCARLEEHKAPAGVAPAGRARDLPGNDHPLMPPWQVAESGPDEVTMRGHFTRFHAGGNSAVHGGAGQTAEPHTCMWTIEGSPPPTSPWWHGRGSTPSTDESCL
jgi:hypothetical protein